MNAVIRSKLEELEYEKKIRILYACESGSRAWGFPSPDSDYDVRFIYVRPVDWYLSLREREDTIDVPINDDLDIGGWDLKKALSLLWKSNPPLMEWIQSPIVYKSDDEFLRSIRAAAEQTFSPIAVMHHYLNMSKKYLEKCLSNEEVRLKHYFYALRTIVACLWIREKDSMPPIEFPDMLNLLKPELAQHIKHLIGIKGSQEEGYKYVRDTELDSFLKSAQHENEKAASTLRAGKGDITALEALFRKFVL